LIAISPKYIRSANLLLPIICYVWKKKKVAMIDWQMYTALLESLGEKMIAQIKIIELAGKII